MDFHRTAHFHSAVYNNNVDQMQMQMNRIDKHFIVHSINYVLSVDTNVKQVAVNRCEFPI